MPVIQPTRQITEVLKPLSETRVRSGLHRSFFRAAIAITLTAGATWGAWILLQIGFRGGFTTVSVHHVNAHGHAQIYGWVGLMMMGFALQAVPRLCGAKLVRPDLARLSFGLMLAGILLRVVSEPLHTSPLFFASGLLGGGLEIAAIALFLSVLYRTARSSNRSPAAADGYILAGLAWFFVGAIASTIHLFLTTTAVDADQLVQRVATFQLPLRDIQIHGFALLMILGMSQRLLPGLFGLAETSSVRSRRVLVLLVAAIFGEIAAFLLMRTTGNHALWGSIWYGCSVLLGIGSALLVIPWLRGLRKAAASPTRRFVMAAFTWLLISFGLLALLPLQTALIDTHFSHAYYGAIRHAITVGFVTLLILGLAAHAVASWNNIPTERRPALTATFLLVNLGCTLRVLFQILTDFWEGAFIIAGVSGLFEVTGIALWGVALWKMTALPHPDAEPCNG